MKLFKKLILPAMFVFALAGAGMAALAKPNKAPQQAAAEDGYTVYFSNELGFATRNADDDRIVAGDTDGNVNTWGNSLATKCELRITYKNTFGSYWFGVGGYAVYHSGSTVRFLYLTRANGAYSRNAEKSGLAMKTADGSADLISVIDSGGCFTDYVDAVYRYDFTDPDAVKFEFFVTYNDVTYYPFDGNTKLGMYTYINKPSNFDASEATRVMAGANAGAQAANLDLFKFKSNDVHLDNIIQTPSVSFAYESIDNFFFTFNLSEKIFKNKGYFNDHLTDKTYPNRDGQDINLGDGIMINGQTFNWWRSYVPEMYAYSRDAGVTLFPLNAGGKYTPVAIEAHTQSIEFKVVLHEIPMDGIVVTFRAGLFEGYNADTGISYKLEDDLHFYSVVSNNNSPSRVEFVRSPNWLETSLGARAVENWGQATASHGGTYHRYALKTSIPFDRTLIKQPCPADNYRYMYDNLLMNGKSLSYYNAWARGNSKDFTNLSDASTQNPDYELSHPTGSANVNYDLAIRIEILRENPQPTYVFVFSVPDQLVTDLSLGELTFALRDGSDWITSINGVTTILRYSAAANAADIEIVENFIESALHMSDYNENLGYCKDNEHGYYLAAKSAFNALTAEQKEAFKENAQFATARARYEAWAAFNNDANPYDGNLSLSSPNTTANTVQKNNTLIIVIAIISVTLACSTSIFIVIKKRRHNA